MGARRLTFLFPLAVFGSSTAVAQTTINSARSATPASIEAEPSPALRAACGADVQKFCSGLKPLERIITPASPFTRPDELLRLAPSANQT
jgi:hypothetical protein